MRFTSFFSIIVLLFLIGRSLTAQQVSGIDNSSGRNSTNPLSILSSTRFQAPEGMLFGHLNELTRLLIRMPALAPAPENVVKALAWHNGVLYVGGNFISVGSDPINYIARWDGTAWQNLGAPFQGIDGPVETILVDGDKVYVGGEFTTAGTVHTRNIAVWDATTNTWSGFGGGVGGTLRNGVSAIALHDGQLYVGGSFIAAGTTVAANIARWDGGRWYRVGTGMNNPVRALHIDGGYLYAGGEFTIAGDVRAAGIARYNFGADKWENVGVDVGGDVNAITSDNAYIYAGGVFDSVAGQLVNNVIRIDKQSGAWSPMGKGIQGYNYIAGGVAQVKGVERMIVVGTTLFAAGTLSQAVVPSGSGEVLIGLAGLAEWNGQAWSNLSYSSVPGTPINATPAGPRKTAPAPPNIYDIVPINSDTLVIGGDFALIDGVPSPYLCSYSRAHVEFSRFTLPGATRGEEIDNPNRIETARSDAKVKAANVSASQNGLLHDFALPPSSADQQSLFSAGDCTDPGNQHWLPIAPDASTDNGVLALAADANEVYAGGTFVNIYGVVANGIAVRKNGEWSALNDGAATGVNGFVYAIAISGPKVYVGGQFSRAGGIEAHNIAIWNRDSRTWSTLENGISGDGISPAFISDILLHNGEVYVAGNFTRAGETPANNIARWKSNTWSGLGKGIDGTVNTLEFFKDILYAGGSFTRAGDSNSSAIAKWDGSNWSGLNGGLDGHVNDIVSYITDVDTLIVIGGEFIRNVNSDPDSPSIFVHNMIWWNGTDWVAKSSQAPSEPPYVDINGEVRAMLVVQNDLYVAGKFTDAVPRGTGSAGGTLTNIAFFNQWPFQGLPIPMWHTLAGGLNGNVNALAISGDEIFAGGDFTRTVKDGLGADHIGRWSLTELRWLWAGNPTALAPVQNLVFHKNRLYASGSFTSQDAGLFEVSNNLVQLAQSGWRLVDGTIRGTPYDLALAPDDEIVVGGALISSQDGITVNVSRLNPATGEWNPLTPGSGVASLEDISFVSAVAADKDHIYVGGSFDIADTLVVQNVACWDRRTGAWKKLGDGLNGAVTALVVDTDGTLYAGGSFRQSGNNDVDRIARWNGTSWQQVGDGINGPVSSLAIADGILYAGGTFNRAGLITANNVAQWNIAGRKWSPLGAGLNSKFEPQITTLVISKGHLFAAGKFEVSGTDSIQNIARWNPGGWWDRLGSGTDAFVTSLAADDANGLIYVGGYFLNAGCQRLQYAALWQDPTLSVNVSEETFTENILQQATPNPFTGTMTVTLKIPEGKNNRVTLTLFDATGREVRTLVEASLPSGIQTIPLEGEDLAAGVYLLRLQSDRGVECRHLVKW